MQPSLFGDDLPPPVETPPLPPAQRHSETSVAAAAQIAGVAGRLQRAVYEYLRSRGAEGATDEEIQSALAMPASTERPRRVELVESGHCEDSGRTRLTRSGRKAVVWIARESGS